MKIKIFQLDAFTKYLFKGNPAAVCLLDYWLDDDILQSIASENNLSETAFLVPRAGNYHIRWFTPKLEVSLCGHATLASAFVVLNLLTVPRDSVEFYSLGGNLLVTRGANDFLQMDFPALSFTRADIPSNLSESLGVNIIEYYISGDSLAIVDSEQTIRTIAPDFNLLKQINKHGLVVSARGDHVDFVTRFFAPNEGVDEDPIT